MSETEREALAAAALDLVEAVQAEGRAREEALAARERRNVAAAAFSGLCWEMERRASEEDPAAPLPHGWGRVVVADPAGAVWVVDATEDGPVEVLAAQGVTLPARDRWEPEHGPECSPLACQCGDHGPAEDAAEAAPWEVAR